MKILESYWFIGGGIVRVQTDYDGIRYYISTTARVNPNNSALNPTDDAQYIAEWGSTFPKAAGDALFGMVEDHKSSEE